MEVECVCTYGENTSKGKEIVNWIQKHRNQSSKRSRKFCCLCGRTCSYLGKFTPGHRQPGHAIHQGAISEFTLPETNSFAPENGPPWKKGDSYLETIIFRCYASFREGIIILSYFIMVRYCTRKQVPFNYRPYRFLESTHITMAFLQLSSLKQT